VTELNTTIGSIWNLLAPQPLSEEWRDDGVALPLPRFACCSPTARSQLCRRTVRHRPFRLALAAARGAVASGRPTA